ncbi:MAG TPA: hypothetical protein VHF24_10635 [Acidimicrobiales bacterium]|jgi:hypothetical protein|nr:hypothetical protein [Acidimicrobiales bacterium]
MLGPMAAASIRFAAAARRLAAACRARHLAVPAFRSPPRLAGAARSIRRRPDGTAVVAVAVRGRPFADVAADMVEGVLVANRLAGPSADGVRAALLAAVVQGDDARAA